ncbi:hypothetical protein NE237_022147 [Protea cynaroides]|uniref:Uncharacterized protein n=1 Tax=Protea cynaroides TaxID=273540 RepID=A0A9Q0K5I5_9MAGN|nr:hypothetical protein NE237_022147 [Protea cynaroides]
MGEDGDGSSNGTVDIIVGEVEAEETLEGGNKGGIWPLEVVTIGDGEDGTVEVVAMEVEKVALVRRENRWGIGGLRMQGRERWLYLQRCNSSCAMRRCSH